MLISHLFPGQATELRVTASFDKPSLHELFGGQPMWVQLFRFSGPLGEWC